MTRESRIRQARRSMSVLFLSYLCAVMTGCADQAVTQSEACSGYPEPQASPYVLPYTQGDTHPVIQENCAPQRAPWTHFGAMRYAYDFGMPIGTPLVASRSGTVIFVRDQFTDEQHRQEQGNAIVVLHEDGSSALYGHITHRGSKVKPGDRVEQGEVLALSGNSGESPTPHLHFQVNACADFSKCPSIPVSFRNEASSSTSLKKGQSYTAQ